MITTVLFDLDGTLLPMDFHRFMQLYFHHMSEHMGDRIDTQTLAKDVLEATEYMIKTNDGRTNYELFMSYFQTLVDEDIQEYERLFESYYESSFEQVKASTYVSSDMTQAVKILKDKGYTIAIATNPLFPYRANLHRIRWAGLNRDDFVHVTSLEENTFCKPFPQFYQEVLTKIDKTPEECIMVGNDVFDDLPASKLGIKTYLTTDCMLNEKNLPLNADYIGSYNDFLQFVQDLPDLS